jgi:hypothetical protein
LVSSEFHLLELVDFVMQQIFSSEVHPTGTWPVDYYSGGSVVRKTEPVVLLWALVAIVKQPHYRRNPRTVQERTTPAVANAGMAAGGRRFIFIVCSRD